jgi:hypothetical protein
VAAALTAAALVAQRTALAQQPVATAAQGAAASGTSRARAVAARRGTVTEAVAATASRDAEALQRTQTAAAARRRRGAEQEREATLRAAAEAVAMVPPGAAASVHLVPPPPPGRSRAHTQGEERSALRDAETRLAESVYGTRSGPPGRERARGRVLRRMRTLLELHGKADTCAAGNDACAAWLKDHIMENEAVQGEQREKLHKAWSDRYIPYLTSKDPKQWTDDAEAFWTRWLRQNIPIARMDALAKGKSEAIEQEIRNVAGVQTVDAAAVGDLVSTDAIGTAIDKLVVSRKRDTEDIGQVGTLRDMVTRSPDDLIPNPNTKLARRLRRGMWDARAAGYKRLQEISDNRDKNVNTMQDSEDKIVKAIGRVVVKDALEDGMDEKVKGAAGEKKREALIEALESDKIGEEANEMLKKLHGGGDLRARALAARALAAGRKAAHAGWFATIHKVMGELALIPRVVETMVDAVKVKVTATTPDDLLECKPRSVSNPLEDVMALARRIWGIVRTWEGDAPTNGSMSKVAEDCLRALDTAEAKGHEKVREALAAYKEAWGKKVEDTVSAEVANENNSFQKAEAAKMTVPKVKAAWEDAKKEVASKVAAVRRKWTKVLKLHLVEFAVDYTLVNKYFEQVQETQQKKESEAAAWAANPLDGNQVKQDPGYGALYGEDKRAEVIQNAVQDEFDKVPSRFGADQATARFTHQTGTPFEELAEKAMAKTEGWFTNVTVDGMRTAATDLAARNIEAAWNSNYKSKQAFVDALKNPKSIVELGEVDVTDLDDLKDAREHVRAVIAKSTPWQYPGRKPFSWTVSAWKKKVDKVAKCVGLDDTTAARATVFVEPWKTFVDEQIGACRERQSIDTTKLKDGLYTWYEANKNDEMTTIMDAAMKELRDSGNITTQWNAKVEQGKEAARKWASATARGGQAGTEWDTEKAAGEVMKEYNVLWQGMGNNTTITDKDEAKGIDDLQTSATDVKDKCVGKVDSALYQAFVHKVFATNAAFETIKKNLDAAATWCIDQGNQPAEPLVQLLALGHDLKEAVTETGNDVNPAFVKYVFDKGNDDVKELIRKFKVADNADANFPGDLSWFDYNTWAKTLGDGDDGDKWRVDDGKLTYVNEATYATSAMNAQDVIKVLKYNANVGVVDPENKNKTTKADLATRLDMWHEKFVKQQYWCGINLQDSLTLVDAMGLQADAIETKHKEAKNAAEQAYIDRRKTDQATVNQIDELKKLQLNIGKLTQWMGDAGGVAWFIDGNNSRQRGKNGWPGPSADANMVTVG